MDVSAYTEDNRANYVHISDIPQVCKDKPCVLGIDEAGRGPVLGPMVYGIAFCPVDKNTDLKELGVDDSKVLTEAQREQLLKKLFDNSDYIGWAIHVLSSSYISTSMYRRGKYNLNTMSHDTAIGLINKAIESGVRVSEVYVDTVGPPDKYQAKLEGIFPELKITVAKKADSLYACVSAASICAKVARDKALKEWKFAEDKEFTKAWGSGYPGDAVTKKFLQDNLNGLFGFPSIVRFSWKTSEKLLEEKAVKVEFEEVEPEEDESVNPSVKAYFTMAPSAKDKRTKNVASKTHPYFRDRGLTSTSCF
jgi:ribonuclease H2 subunit A